MTTRSEAYTLLKKRLEEGSIRFPTVLEMIEDFKAVKDMFTSGVGFTKNGKYINPENVYKTPKPEERTDDF